MLVFLIVDMDYAALCPNFGVAAIAILSCMVKEVLGNLIRILLF